MLKAFLVKVHYRLFVFSSDIYTIATQEHLGDFTYESKIESYACVAVKILDALLRLQYSLCTRR